MVQKTDIKNMQLYDPIRGYLSRQKYSKDGLNIYEEYYRIQAINYLLSRGYPKENFLIEPVIKRFGNSARNSFRSDLAILDGPKESIDVTDVDSILKHAIIIGEIKRDNAKSNYVENTQVAPMLDFAKRTDALGLYWDDLEQRVFWQEIVGNSRSIHSGPLGLIPIFGSKFRGGKELTFADLVPAKSLEKVFSKIEDILYSASFGPESRYEMILQLLLAKIFDEHDFETRRDSALEVQDFQALGYSPSAALRRFSDLVDRAVRFYENHLPNKINHKVKYTGDTLFEILKVLAPIKIIDSSRDVVQTFYMKFAKQLYKWDLAQYFTPPTVTDFLVDLINPQFGEKVLDPASGSADFLVATFRKGRKFNPGFADNIYGIDNSENAVQIAVLNMVLNGDGKSNLRRDDSLEHVIKYENRFDIVTSNPPFGSKILEKRVEVLKQFSLGHAWEANEREIISQTDRLLEQQETGILFAEAVIRFTRSGSGRYLIILPNGYLGNTSIKFRSLRKYILSTSKIVAIISLPRFTFKASGADVSASVIIAEKRQSPLSRLDECDEYPISVQTVNKLGWSAGDKKGKPMYARDIRSGSILTDTSGEPIIDSDFIHIINGLRHSDAASGSTWLNRGIEEVVKDIDPKYTWTINSTEIIADKDLTLDPKRYSYKAKVNKHLITNGKYKQLGEIVSIIPEGVSLDGKKQKKSIENAYRYIDISSMQYGEYTGTELRGWELPSRAKHFAVEGDIYVGSIWGSVSKWIYIGQNSGNLVVTNGAFRLRMKKGSEKYLADLLAYISSESWAVQMRSLSRGSDGLAEIQENDLKSVVIPILRDQQRQSLKAYVDNLRNGRSTLKDAVTKQITDFDIPNIPRRYSHINLV